jgi:hypothetical protein
LANATVERRDGTSATATPTATATADECDDPDNNQRNHSSGSRRDREPLS